MPVKARRTISGEAKAAEALEDLQGLFKISAEWAAPLIEEAAALIARDGRTEQAVMAFVAIPAKPRYAQARMTLLWRILLVPERYRHTPWNRAKFDQVVFLPDENTAIERYLLNNTNVLAALAGPRHCSFEVIEGGCA